MVFNIKRLWQTRIYERLQTHGSPWLKSHVLFADNRVVVLNKPAGLVCLQKTTKHGLKSELDMKYAVYEDVREWLAPLALPQQVHRLDKMTSGCLLVPLNPSSTMFLSSQFKQNQVTKTYLALVRGDEKSFPAVAGEIKEPILYTGGHAEKNLAGKMARTRWKLIGSSPRAPISLLQLELTTSNKHQLRIHLANVLKSPILGDTTYSPKPLEDSTTSLAQIPDDRLFLHSAEISFFQYSKTGKGERLTIGAPVPHDFRKLCIDLDIPLPPSNQKASLSVDGQGQVRDRNSTLRLWDPSRNYMQARRYRFNRRTAINKIARS